LQNLLSAVARVVAFAVFARLISVEEMGIYTILVLGYSAASVFFVLGMTSVVTKFVAENMAKGNKVQAASVYYVSLVLAESASILIAVCFLIAKFPAGISHIPTSQVISLISLLFFADVAISFGAIPQAVLYGLLEFKTYAVIYTAYTSLRPWIVILLIYWTKSLVGLVGGWVVADTALSITMFLYLWRRLGPPVFKFDAKYLLKLSAPLYVASIASFLYGTFDQLTLIPLVSLSALGVYGAAITGYSAYSGVIGVLGSVLLPVLSGVHGVNGREALVSGVERASRYVSIIAMPLAFGLMVLARPALTLLVGKVYEGGILPLAILAFASTASIISLALGPVLIVLNETLLAALASILPIPISVAVALLAIPTLGIVGASVARGLSMLLGLLFTWYFVKRKIPVKLDNATILKSILASVVMAAALEAMQLVYYNKFLLLVYMVVGLVVYLLAMRALKALNPADIDIVRKTLGTRFRGLCDLLERLVLS
jgi:O-antigen/teichoic acid export membrane protein